MPHVVVKVDRDHFFHAAITRPRTNLGSGSWEQDVHVSIAHGSVLPLHVSIEAIEGGHMLVDRSGGRARVNGRPASEITLVDGTRIELGQVEVTFYERAAPEDPETIADRDESPPAAKLWLLVKRPGGRERARRVPIGEGLTIGSAGDRDVRLEHPTVSGHHARIAREPKRLRIEDESRNGTLVNQVPIEACTLRPGAIVQIGPYVLEVRGEEAQAPAGLEEFHGLLTADPTLMGRFALVAKIGADGCNAVIRGETGTGKEGVARAIHALSPCSGGPFVDVNCGAIPEQLFEVELFGSRAGAFTGAVNHDGHFVRADGGTLFLDELGELPLAMQAKLLRAVQEGVVQPLGAGEPVAVKVRVVAATNRDLRHEIAAGRFRSDLYFRLAVAMIDLPPLRDRGEDAVLLFERLLERARPTEPPPALTGAAKARLRAHPWPGNVRELANVVSRARLHLGRERLLGPELLELEPPVDAPGAPGAGDALFPKGLRWKQIEREAIAIVLRQNKRSKRATARQLGIGRNTLARKLRDFGLEAVDD